MGCVGGLTGWGGGTLQAAWTLGAAPANPRQGRARRGGLARRRVCPVLRMEAQSGWDSPHFPPPHFQLAQGRQPGEEAAQARASTGATRRGRRAGQTAAGQLPGRALLARAARRERSSRRCVRWPSGWRGRCAGRAAAACPPIGDGPGVASRVAPAPASPFCCRAGTSCMVLGPTLAPTLRRLSMPRAAPPHPSATLAGIGSRPRGGHPAKIP